MIEHTLGLPSMEELLASDLERHDIEVEVEEDEIEDETVAVSSRKSGLTLAEGMALGLHNGSDHADAMAEVYKDMLKTARDLVDLGFNVDTRSAATIFEKSAMFYKGAIDAMDSKRKRELDAMKLVLDSRKLENEEKRLNHELGEKPIDAEATILEDRNELIRRAREIAKNEAGQ